MAKRELPMNGAEHDALTRWRKFQNWRPGVRSWIKRGYNKRVRLEVRRQLQKFEE